CAASVTDSASVRRIARSPTGRSTRPSIACWIGSRRTSVSSDGPESRVRVPAEWDRLELSVRRLLDDHERVRERERAAERRIQELETLLREVTGGGLDPVALNARVAALEAENRELVRRL